MIDFLIQLKDYVPFFQTLLWILLIGSVVLIFRRYIYLILDTTVERIRQGSSFKAGPIEVGEMLNQLEYISQNQKTNGNKDCDREAERVSVYEGNNGLFLTHVILPSKTDGQVWDVFVYLIRHKSKDFSDVKSASFFFGHMWGNKTFEERERGGIIGIKTSAYAPFLCTCDVTMLDGSIVKLHRYIDFEMKQVIRLF